MIRALTIPGRCAFAVFALALAVSAQAQKPGSASARPSTRQISISQLESEIKRDPNNPRLHVALGLAYWDRNDYPHALEAFQRAVKVGPSSAEAHNWLGVALL
jgi:cytochrome c-type biogenesis protein CcmH/NrfG